MANLACSLEQHGYETHVCCLGLKGEFSSRLPHPERIVALGKKPGFSLKALWSLSRVIRRLEPHVIHTHNLGPLIYSSLATSGGQSSPILHSEHSQLAPEELQPKRFLQRKIFYGCAQRVHTVSRALSQELISKGLHSNPITIQNGVDTERFQPCGHKEARQKIGLPGNIGQLIGIFARFGPHKRHDLLLEAFSILGRKAPLVHLLVVGGGGVRESAILKQIETHEFRDRIHFCGFQADPVPYYQAVDLLVVPSVNEGLSNATLEAMACGVPVLSHSSCGSEEIISQGIDGWIESISDAQALSDSILGALRYPERLDLMGRKARHKIQERFALSTMAQEYAELYQELSGLCSG